MKKTLLAIGCVAIIGAIIADSKASSNSSAIGNFGGTGVTSGGTSGGGSPSTWETFSLDPVGEETLYLCGTKSNQNGTSSVTPGNSMSVSYNLGSTWVNVPNTAQVSTGAAWPVIRGSGSAYSSQNVAWSGYAKIYWPTGLEDGNGNVYTNVKVVYQVDDIGYASAMAYTQAAGNSATAYGDSDDGISADASQSGANSANEDVIDDELPSYTTETYTSATYSKSDLTSIGGDYYVTPYTTFFTTALTSGTTYTQAAGQSMQSNGGGSQANVFFDTSGSLSRGSNAVVFGF